MAPASNKSIHRNQQHIHMAPASNKFGPKTTTRYLPDELISNILIRVPVKNLVKFKYISKSWLSLITNPSFIQQVLAFSNQHSSDQQDIIFLTYEKVQT
ncbi:hypothetical protein AQUCO_01600107v1 [Aquilegia coerulea]|uniref:F-box domain-containing protein n=1 Tax=Aquilegia coerulea TaxID=218851 RepID=A0A2G5DQ67_AQUCA|nr:hypothetical protein AQUCO_01600107v1 [Aquilegia coerulea]